jgi:Leucine-rich repeat (LRR) protein
METNSATIELKVITNVAFTDPNLEQAVRDGLGIPTAPLTPEDFIGVTYLTVSWRDLTNLSGLEAAVDLEELDLGGNPALQSHGPLSFLPRLGFLHVYDCHLDDLSFVAGLSSLTALEAAHNFIEDLAPLTFRPGLQYLDLQENELTQIEPLLALPALAHVRLANNRLDTNATSAAWNVITNLQARGVLVEFAPQRPAPIRPVILTQPVSLAAYAGDNISLTVHADGGGAPLNFRWLRDGVPLSDNARFHNTGGDVLWIDNVQPGDAGSYRVRIWNDYGMTNSRTVTLRVLSGVAFVDPNLERAVRDRLGIPSALLAPADLAALDWLDAYHYGITNLSGLEAAANLFWLSLAENPGITDFSPLTLLPRLQNLYLGACNLQELDFLPALPPLRDLELRDNPITDLAPLAAQPGLHWLNLGRCSGVTNFAVLAGLTALESLALGETGCSNLAFAASLPDLRELDLWGDAVTDLAPLTGATNLARLELNGNHVTNAAPLASCTNLQWLSLNGNRVGDLAFTTPLPALWFLAAYDTGVRDLTPLAGRTNLTWLDVGGNPLTNLAPVATLTRLTDLHVWNLGLSNLSFLAPLTNLQVFGAGVNAITNLPPYPHLNQLRQLNLEWNPLASIAFVSGMTNLTDLALSGTGVADLGPLTGRASLRVLGLAQNGVTDIAPLATLPHLGWLTLYHNNLQSIAALAGLTNLTYVDLRENFLNPSPGSAAMTVVAALQGRGTWVEYLPQRTAPASITLGAPTWLDGSQFRFTITSAPGAVLQIWRSADLINWTSAGWVTNTTGTTTFTAAAISSRFFYRAQQQ